MAGGIVADRLLDPWGTATWALIALAAAIIALIANRSPRTAIPALLVALAAMGGAWHHRRWSDLPADDLARSAATEPRPAWVRGLIATVPEYRPGPLADRTDDPGHTRFELRLTASSDGRCWHPASGGVVVSVGGDRTDLGMGDPIEAAGELALLAGPLNPGERDAREFPRSRRIRLRLSVDTPQGIALDPTGRPAPFWNWLGRIRAGGERRLSALLGDRVAPMAFALLLGRRGGIDEETADAFTRTGAAHVLAISGLHLSAVAGAIGVLACVAGLGRKGAARLVLVATASYATLVGWSPSVGRSAAMVAAASLATLVDRPYRTANTLALAALFTLAVNPSDLFRVGWMLSFLAVSVLALVARPIGRGIDRLTSPDPDGDPLDLLERRLEPPWRRAARRIALGTVAALAVSAAVWLATAPLVAWRFHVVAPIGILLNLPIIPLILIAVLSGGTALLLSVLWEPIAWPASRVCSWALSMAMTLVERAEAIPLGHAFVPAPPTSWLIALYGTLALAVRALVARWPSPACRTAWVGVAVVGAITSAITMTPRRPPSFEVEFLAVGHGLATVIQGPDGSAALYDCGRSGDPSIGRRIVAPALWARGVRRLECLVISHADTDHYNGVPDLLDRVSVGRLVVPDGFGGPDNPGAEGVLDRARALGIPIRFASAGDRLPIVPGLDALVLHPGAGWLPDAPDNDRSLVLDLDRGGRHLLLTGDLDGAGLAELVSRPRRPVDVLLAPHHGGRSANPAWLYDWADPALVVVSQRAPRAGTSDALRPVAEAGVAVRRTWEDGAVLVRWLDPASSGPVLLASGWVGPTGPTGTIPPAVSSRAVSAMILAGPPSAPLIRALTAVAGLALGAWLCLAMAVIRWGAWALVLPGRGTGHDEGLPPPWRPESITASDGLRLSGWRLDADDSRGRIALVLHGLAESSASMRARAETLHRLGWSVLVPDHRSFGRSEGDRASFGTREADDIGRWLDALGAGRPGARVLLWGRSMGAAVSLRVAAEDTRISALILEAPYADLRRATAARLARLPLPGASMLAGAVLAQASRIAGVPLDRPRPTDLAPLVSSPTLILQGEADPITPPDEIRLLANAFPPDHPPEIVSVPGAGHSNVFDSGGPALIDRLSSFLLRLDGADPHRLDA
ncbi:ComEC/Rec2 family competence protein [Tautonia sociabilis]|uniref:ComEC/Rec2 family competence protein n=1 Tax=Tautonia sociabilis TaxID=2080755 RepID=UPI0013159382|nr:ComEC/Rec2 family competence protein [Tautonia sociabilis]